MGQVGGVLFHRFVKDRAGNTLVLWECLSNTPPGFGSQHCETNKKQPATGVRMLGSSSRNVTQKVIFSLF